MEYTKLGSTGLDVSRLCFGTWRFNNEAADGTIETDREEAHRLLDAFADLGGNFIDTANVYGNGKSEAWIGEWLADRDREDFVIASKVHGTQESRFSGNIGRKNIRAEIEGTLSRLDTSYLDLYYIHGWDEETPIQETLQTMTQLVNEGKVHYLSASNLAAWQLMKSLWTSDANQLERFEATQPKFNAADRPQEFLDVCADQDIAVCPYCPLEQGFLTGKYDREIPEGSRGDINNWDMDYSGRQWDVLETVETVAEEVDATPAQVSLRWLMDQREFTCVPIFGARTVDQMTENLDAIDVTLTNTQFDRITEAYEEGE